MINEIKAPEILAPVGGSEQLLAAVRCGADAVYFGLQNFNARRNADNFAGEDLRRTIEYCHERGVKVFITINTLIKDSELADMRKAVDTACSAGADGLIVQDLAVMAYAKDRWPDADLVASTQMAVHNVEGTKLLQQMGFSRAVLARELSLDEIRDIYDQTGMELESFVHGAHCMSVSGLCYLSSMIGGRSGNRGLCAQPCRLDCSLCGRDHALSLKDLSFIDHIKELADAGVKSLKIEGRMKRPEYVAASVIACRAAINGEDPDMDTLRSVFSRSGFTDGYLTGKRGVDMFGYRTKEDVTAATDVLGELAKKYEREPQNMPVDMFLYVKEGHPSKLSVRSNMVENGQISYITAESYGTVPQAAKTLPITEEYAFRSLSKTGGTPYYLRDLKLFAGDGLMLPASALNELRRAALDALGRARVEAFETQAHAMVESSAVSGRAMAEPFNASGRVSADVLEQKNSLQGTFDSEGNKNALWARFSRLDQLFSGCPETVVLPLDELVGSVLTARNSDEIREECHAINFADHDDKEENSYQRCHPERSDREANCNTCFHDRSEGSCLGIIDHAHKFGVKKIIAEIPSVVWPSYMDAVRDQLRKLKELNIIDVYVENLGSLELCHEYGFTAHGGMFLNILNADALRQYSSLGLVDTCFSFEMSFSDMRKLLSSVREDFLTGAVVYGYLPLMKFRNCPAKGKNGCGKCTGLNYLTDRKGENFPVVCQARQYSELLNCVPLCVSDRNVPPVDHNILYFTTETSQECAEITALCREKAMYPGRKTAGLYFRELL